MTTRRGLARWLGLVHDITEQRLSERELRARPPRDDLRVPGDV